MGLHVKTEKSFLKEGYYSCVVITGRQYYPVRIGAEEVSSTLYNGYTTSTSQHFSVVKCLEGGGALKCNFYSFLCVAECSVTKNRRRIGGY